MNSTAINSPFDCEGVVAESVAAAKKPSQYIGNGKL
jgi:hypothetical protein